MNASLRIFVDLWHC